MSAALIAGAVIAGGTAAYAAHQQGKASKAAANQMRDIQTYDPVRPDAPQLLDWRRAADSGLSYNNARLAQNFGFANQVNRFNTGQALQQYRTFQPQFDALQRQVGQNALQYSQGALPQDVVESIGRAAASRGLASGFGQGARGGGTGTALSNSLMRGLGLTSLDLSKFGTQLAMNANMQAKQLSPGLFDPTQLMINPTQAIGYEAQNVNTQNEAARYWNQLQNQALLQNTGATNTANQNATNTELAGKMAQAQAIQQAGSSIGGIGMQYATNQNQNYVPSQSMAGAPSGGAVAGYGYNPSSGYYKLS